MDILFATSDTALGFAVTGALESQGHAVASVTNRDTLAEAWSDHPRFDLAIIDDMADDGLLDAVCGDLNRHGDDGTRVLLLSTPPRTQAANRDSTPSVRRQTPLPTIRRTVANAAKPAMAKPRQPAMPSRGGSLPASATSTAAPAAATPAAATSPSASVASREAAPDGPRTRNHPDLPIRVDATIVKPFSDAELLSRVHALSQDRDDGDGRGPGMLIHGDLTLDTRAGRAFYRNGGQPLALSPREYKTLETLIRADGEFLTFDELLETVCGTGVLEQRDIMDGVLYSLTRKLRRLGFFITQRGHKYRIR
ncbi:winged helix-turn-helix domain-containing protein [Bifidobacterium leontopitheci]|uniref:Transcriptional regulator n=1 Tax=Bifidobacterium leontopitheci TaxID=2650774 RepID=A0A6I1GWZ4_9BIFI|nr:winged helix-turn-helix domain-containing protein [Bifidobacterium leontopitheci]KAB7790971.1 transcriptional regulator [Bifidobacterium leontopitheci]